MYNHNKAQQSKNRVHISWDILYIHAWSGQLLIKVMVVRLCDTKLLHKPILTICQREPSKDTFEILIKIHKHSASNTKGNYALHKLLSAVDTYGY